MGAGGGGNPWGAGGIPKGAGVGLGVVGGGPGEHLEVLRAGALGVLGELWVALRGPWGCWGGPGVLGWGLGGPYGCWGGSGSAGGGPGEHLEVLEDGFLTCSC